MFSYEHCKIFKSTYFKKHLRTNASDSSIYFIKSWIKLLRNQISLLFHFETWNQSALLTLICFHSFYCSLSYAVIHCYFLLLVVICSNSMYHSLLFIFICCTTCCHSVLLVCHSLSLVVIRCTTRFHSLSLVVIRCHSLSLIITQCTTRLSFYKRSPSCFKFSYGICCDVLLVDFSRV